MSTLSRSLMMLAVFSLVGCAQDSTYDPVELEGKAELSSWWNDVWFDSESESSLIAEALLRGGLPGNCMFFDLMPSSPQMWHRTGVGKNKIGIMIDDFHIRVAPEGIPHGKSISDLKEGDYERIDFRKQDLRGCEADPDTQSLTCTYYYVAALINITKVIRIDTVSRTVTSFEVIEDLLIDSPKTTVKCVGD